MPDLYIVEFKGYRRGLYHNTYYHSLELGEHVIVEAERGEDMGKVSKVIPENSTYAAEEKPLSILRPASSEEVSSREYNCRDENAALKQCEILVRKHALPMKLIDSEYQHDRNKLTFYFTADQRVDFRALVRDLAAIYKTRIELRQIGVRDAARRLGGFGVCGLMQCCTTHLQKFEPISTQFAREQNLSLNPTKISGNCGRLLCCLAYEKDHYRESVEKFPEQGQPYTTDKGEGVVETINVFENYMVVRHTDGDISKVTLNEIRLKERHKKSFFKNWRDKQKKQKD
ncbi:MAG: regulatory iron-sulfur-containing complex subunit RicT [Candidatus Zixiibacteriota bacterium]